MPAERAAEKIETMMNRLSLRKDFWLLVVTSTAVLHGNKGEYK
jgi:hypothetical protein